ncbi:short-chain fatty acyl-CoA regulator family protein [Lentzea sp. NPDC058436]|uniref:short-chain fatty acyl-CoA regulator family protein n=1 Tax=Lentzea sp. NPDC058436 TaxID=3346499 RepID=UPI00364AF619
MDKTFVGHRLRQLIADRALSQVEVARLLEISPSYLNQLLHNSRPLTVPVLLKITEVFGVDASFFAHDDAHRLLAELREVFSDLGAPVPTELAGSSPDAARAVIALHRRYREASEQLTLLTGDSEDAVSVTMPHEDARDFFYERQNYIAVLDEPAEQLAQECRLRRGEVRTVLTERLAAHGIRVSRLETADERHRYDPATRVLHLSTGLRPGQQAFRMAVQVAYAEHGDLLTSLAAEVRNPQSRTLTRIGLANYFAAAFILPYKDFLATAESFRYDVERLTDHYGLGFETICHRLSTLQRPRSRGVPFSFIRIDRAGNMSKRQSATGFHFSRTGGTCPLWNIYEAFSAPGRVLRQIAVMPDGRGYFWIARTVTRRPHRWGTPTKTYAVGLGCELRHASRLIYSAGLDLDDHEAAVPIGPGCKTCPRIGCAQRAFPQVGRTLAIDENHSTFSPYPVHD